MNKTVMKATMASLISVLLDVLFPSGGREETPIIDKTLCILSQSLGLYWDDLPEHLRRRIHSIEDAILKRNIPFALYILPNCRQHFMR